MKDPYYEVKAISASQVKDFAEDPLTFWNRSPFNSERKPQEISDAMIFGQACHCLLLEGEDKFNETFAIADFGKSRRNKEYDKVKLIYPEKEVISPFELDKAIKMSNAVKNHPIAGKLLEGSVCETPVYFTDKDTGLSCKSKFDSIKRQDNKIIKLNDYKTTSDVNNYLNPFRFADTYNWLQSAFYRKAMFTICPELKQIEKETGEIMVSFNFIVQSSVEDEENCIACFEPSLDLYRTGDEYLEKVMPDLQIYLNEKLKNKENLKYSFYQENFNDTLELNLPNYFVCGYEKKGFNKLRKE